MNHNNFTVEHMISMLEERDRIAPINEECNKFNIKNGDIVIDYGCGSGGYTKKISEILGESGKVYAVDIYELAIESVKKKINKYQLTNVETVLAKNINEIKDNVANIIIAIDMFHMVQEKNKFLKELHRLINKDGTLFIGIHHMTSEEVQRIILDSKLWEIQCEIDNCLKCIPIIK
ncbi:class I SAM-dependent methyltransferase [Clostridium beijerinckii]|uniref:16S rRNA (Cytosine(1402)-N(4))-methyltransferase n=1 Tax=Clostridium beijerinckii TaxID=1520 RepID=A0A1S9N2W9_CLOBE|nr:class I SAM-dependent methyltransferase [Clostridium beijerinckii]MZK49185.1 methyltransferase domain-containing protein [Clostridium beijerinckii]MZK57016.1 methyltransferase domain-containing protein [Clostridium beijerinckii]MZK67227.1 methyltransferase domain-containing protein [Clostridium beijerinckii]MZK72854.1 methyltransferase domain-containing protein [Clostridium beijerinckii]MZK82450.1 methyltransferase domain-containing protein [Clostridium beijerinckii]